MFLTTLFEHPATYVVSVLVVVVSVVLHELGHAAVATWEGDPTPRLRGHLTWNPVVHMGWFALGLLAVAGITFGETPIEPSYFRHRRWGDTLVSLAGPCVNFVLAFLATFPVALLERSGSVPDRFYIHELPPHAQVWYVLLRMNVVLFLLNLIPLPPLDGFKAVDGAVDLGGFGAGLKRLGWIPLVVAVLIFNSEPFGVITDVFRTALQIPAVILVGAF